jgi:hypothetical protein
MLTVPPLTTRARRARHRLRTRVFAHPALYLPFARLRYPGPSPEVIGPHTQLVIDGYTRSATTFAVYALQTAQPAPVRLAHHLHAPAQLIAAARGGVPAVALIREPQGAVLSQLIAEPWVSLRDALAAYARFYECLLSYRGAFVVADFEEVTRDFGAVIRRVNERFGTSFAEFVPSEPNVRQCYELIGYRATLSPVLLGFESGTVTLDELHRELPVLARPDPEAERAWIPSEERARSKAALRAQWLRPGLARHRERAERAYRTFRQADGIPGPDPQRPATLGRRSGHDHGRHGRYGDGTARGALGQPAGGARPRGGAYPARRRMAGMGADPAPAL